MTKSVPKKIVTLILVCVICLLSFSACSKSNISADEMRIAFISSRSDITDGGFNWMTYSGLKKFAEEHNVDFTYYCSPEDNTDSFLSMIDLAIDKDYNAIFCNGSSFGRALNIASKLNPNVKFIGVDVAKDSFDPAAKNNPDIEIPSNVFLCTFKNQYSGFLAGYGAVKDGYRHLGFLGGVSVSSVRAYGYGYIQGIETAAKEMGLTDVTVEYAYGNQFFGDPTITAHMDTWLGESIGAEVVFSCGGKIWTSLADSCKKYKNKKIIGVDIDQRDEINAYTGMDTTLTSAMLSLDVAAEHICNYIYADKWNELEGTALSLGLANRDNVDENVLRLPTKSWAFKHFTIDEYSEIVKNLYDEKIELSFNVNDDLPKTTVIKVNNRGNIK